MVRVTRLDGKQVVINDSLIELMEATPDTVLTLTTGKKIVVRESVDEIVERIIQFKRESTPIILGGAP